MAKTKEDKTILTRFPNKNIRLHASPDGKKFSAEISFTNVDESQVLIKFVSQLSNDEQDAINKLLDYLKSKEGYNSLIKAYL